MLTIFLCFFRGISSWQVQFGAKICKRTVSWIPRKYNWRWVSFYLYIHNYYIHSCICPSIPSIHLSIQLSNEFFNLYLYIYLFIAFKNCYLITIWGYVVLLCVLSHLPLCLLLSAAFLTQTVCLDDTTVKFEIWDTAGQERYHSLAPMYYRGAQAAIVVYDITNQDTFGRAKTWVKELQRQASPNIVIALSGNKADLSSKRMVEYEVSS